MSRPLICQHGDAPVRCLTELDDGRICTGDQRGCLVVLRAGSAIPDGTMTGHEGLCSHLWYRLSVGGQARCCVLMALTPVRRPLVGKR